MPTFPTQPEVQVSSIFLVVIAFDPWTEEAEEASEPTGSTWWVPTQVAKTECGKPSEEKK